MLFNSIPFLFFFLAVFPTFFLLPPKYRWVLLIAASYYFYMYWNFYFVFLLGFSTLLDYFFGLAIARTADPKARKSMLILSISINLAFLFVFKYFDFASASLNAFFEKSGMDFAIPIFHLILPVGISFYTFHSLSYIVDVYKGAIPAEKHLGKYAIYVCFFPLLVAGPIERGSHLLPQLQRNDHGLDFTKFLAGFTQAVFGFFKKVVVADGIAIYVNSIYNHSDSHSGATLLFATYLFAFQIYCDFSGYSDIAVGIARMMGYDLFLNFRLPYFSKSVTEFWRRWHISLSSWLRDYLYIPLGGSRDGKFNTYRNLLITMLLGGLWHGASWTFVAWGGLNGLFLSIEKMLGVERFRLNRNFFTKAACSFLTFNLICVTWVFFRSSTFAQAGHILRTIAAERHFSVHVRDMNILITACAGLAIMLLFEYGILRKNSFLDLAKKWNPAVTLGFNLAFVSMIILFGVVEGSQFIYFQF